MQCGKEGIRVVGFPVFHRGLHFQALRSVGDFGLHGVDQQLSGLDLPHTQETIQSRCGVRRELHGQAVHAILLVTQIAREQILATGLELQRRIGEFAFERCLIDVAVLELAHGQLGDLRATIGQSLPPTARSEAQFQVAGVHMSEGAVGSRGHIEQNILRDELTGGRDEAQIAQFAPRSQVLEVVCTLDRATEVPRQGQGVGDHTERTQVDAIQLHVELRGISPIEQGGDASFAVDQRVAGLKVDHGVPAPQRCAESDATQRIAVVVAFANVGGGAQIGARRIGIEAATFDAQPTGQRSDGLSFDKLRQIKPLQIDLCGIVLALQIDGCSAVHIAPAFLQGKMRTIVGACEIQCAHQPQGIGQSDGARRAPGQKGTHPPRGLRCRHIVQVPRAPTG